MQYIKTGLMVTIGLWIIILLKIPVFTSWSKMIELLSSFTEHPFAFGFFVLWTIGCGIALGLSERQSDLRREHDSKSIDNLIRELTDE